MTRKKPTDIREFAIRYTAAWCSRDAAAVASFFSPNGTSRDNDGPVHAGRDAVMASAQGFMSTFPDLTLYLDEIGERDGKIVYTWTLEGTHCTTGRHVRIAGSEEWTMGDDGLVADSIGRFDVAEYARQAGLT